MLKNLKVLQRLKIWQKVALIAVFMGTPIPIVTYLFVVEKNKAIEFAQLEVYGAHYLVPLKNLSKNLARHRGLTNIFLSGGAAMRSQMVDAERAVDRDFAAVEEIDQKEIRSLNSSYGSSFQTTNQLRAAKRRWDALKSKTTNALPEESFNEHTQLITETTDLIKQVADLSNLILDHDLDTYYLMDSTVTQSPAVVEIISQLRGLGAGIAAAGKIGPGEQAQLLLLAGQARRGMKTFERNLSTAYRANPDLKEEQGDLVEIAVRESEVFTNLAEQKLARAKEIGVAATEYFAAGTQAVERLLKVDEQALINLEALLQTRIDRIAGERNVVLGLILLGVVITVISVVVIARGITRQTDTISNLIARINSGNLAARAEVLSQDELGQTATAFNAMLDNTRGLMQSREERDRIQEAIMKLLNEVSGVAEGDLTREAEVTADITGAIADAFNHMIVELRRLISRVQDVTRQVTSTASETQATTERLAEGSQEQAAQITHTSQALDDMTASIRKVSEDAVMSAAVADQALSTARKGAEAVQATVKGMTHIQEQVQETSRRIRSLGERSQEIEEIVQLIDEFADRTGVLALNASIQASAAGEAGQGFAVVAQEIEQLAQRSTEATRRISNLVQAIRSGTGEAIASMEETTRGVVSGANLASQAGESLGEIGAVSQRLAQLVQMISQASSQQAQGSAHLSRSMAEIATITQETSSGVRRSAVSVKSLAELADELRASVASFKLPYTSGNGNGGAQPGR